MKTKIEWVKNSDGSQGYTINPVKGLCPMACPYCYARRMYLNPYYKNMYEHQEIRFDESVFKKYQKGSKVFIGSTIDLFYEQCSKWNNLIFEYCEGYPGVTFIFLTKQPQNLIKWSPFPDNCWVGVSIDGTNKNINKFASLSCLKSINARVKFISFEPLLDSICIGYRPLWWADAFKEANIDWIIVGQQTPVSAKTQPKVEWIKDIVEAADKARTPMFLKNNLDGLLGYPLPEWAEAQTSFLRQEFPRD